MSCLPNSLPDFNVGMLHDVCETKIGWCTIANPSSSLYLWWKPSPLTLCRVNVHNNNHTSQHAYRSDPGPSLPRGGTTHMYEQWNWNSAQSEMNQQSIVTFMMSKCEKRATSAFLHVGCFGWVYIHVQSHYTHRDVTDHITFLCILRTGW